MSVATTLAADPRTPPTPASHLHGAWADGLLLGGASTVAFVLLRLLDLQDGGLVLLGAVMMGLAHVVNHPHFAHSYQLFYGSWHQVRGGEFAPPLARRWWWAGVVAPALLGAFLVVAAVRAAAGDTLWFAVSLNVLGALVGWHYVKQGFGMAMVDAALKRRFWSPQARRALLVNAYACWIAAWALINDGPGGAYWGYFRIAFDIPGEVIALLCTAVVASTVWCGVAVTRAFDAHRQKGAAWGQLPWNGLLAYAVTLYLWTLFAWVDLAFALVIPFFHSLQYLTVVWRYKANEVAAKRLPARAMWRQMGAFTAVGVVLGGLGFWVVPGLIDYVRTGALPATMSGPAAAMASAWIFINIHHYLIDNVLWRQGNPNVNRHLFQHGRPASHSPA